MQHHYVSLSASDGQAAVNFDFRRNILHVYFCTTGSLSRLAPLQSQVPFTWPFQLAVLRHIISMRIACFVLARMLCTAGWYVHSTRSCLCGGCLASLLPPFSPKQSQHSMYQALNEDLHA